MLSSILISYLEWNDFFFFFFEWPCTTTQSWMEWWNYPLVFRSISSVVYWLLTIVLLFYCYSNYYVHVYIHILIFILGLSRDMHWLNTRALRKQRKQYPPWMGLNFWPKLSMLIGHSAMDLSEGRTQGMHLQDLFKICKVNYQMIAL